MNTIESTTAAHLPAVAPLGAHVASEKAPSKKNATQKKGAPTGRKTAIGSKTSKTRAAAPKKAAKPGNKAAGAERRASAAKKAPPRAESKGAKILEMIRRPKGATLAEIMKAANWQAHSVRGFISTAAKKHGITIDSAKNEAGDRVYKVAK